MKTLQTNRLLLRQWKSQDLPFFAELNSDPAVMEYYPSQLTRQESDALANKCKALIAERGWGLWAVELKSCGEFIGYVGLHRPKSTLPCSPCVEIGWRLAKKYWGNGYATEAAREALRFAFETLDLREVVSFTAVINDRSRSVMQRIGMTNTKQNFEHPDLPEGHALREHVLYKISKSDWQVNFPQGSYLR